MTLIPRKNDMNNNSNEQPKVRRSTKKIERHPYLDALRNSYFIPNILTIFAWVAILYCGMTYLAPHGGGIFMVPVANVFSVILIALVIYSLSDVSLESIIVGIIQGIGDKPVEVDLEGIERSREKSRELTKEKEARAKEISAMAEKDRSNSSYGGKTFNEMQKEKRRADAYKNADPEFIVTYKSKGGAWVKDIVRGRDKAEVYNRYKYNPMVEVMGGVTGINE